MFNKKKQSENIEIDEVKIKSLTLYQSIQANFNEMGYSVIYTRVPTGLIRLVITPEAINQVIIEVPDSYFVIS